MPNTLHRADALRQASPASAAAHVEPQAATVSARQRAAPRSIGQDPRGATLQRVAPGAHRAGELALRDQPIDG